MLFLSPVPPTAAARELVYKLLADCAPLQVRHLSAWGKGPTAVAAVELLGDGGASRLEAAEAIVARAGALEDGGKRVRCGRTASAVSEAHDHVLPVQTLLRKHGLSPAALKAPLPDLLALHAEEAPADEALTEYKRTLASSAGKGSQQQQQPLLLAGILRRRRATDGFERYAGKFNGLPLPKKEARHLQQLLDDLDWKQMGNVRAASINVEYSFSLGMATKALQKQGPFATPFAFKQGMGVWDGASVRKKHKEIWEAAVKLMRAIDPDFPLTSIGFNKNFRGSPHRDEKDAGHQIATGLGDYSGGALRVYGRDGIVDVNTNERWCRFDGRYRHEVLPFEGNRYSVIYYQLEPAFDVDLSTCEPRKGVAVAPSKKRPSSSKNKG